MKRRIIKTVTCITTGVLLLLFAVVIALTLYYRNGFGIGTWINGIYCTGKDVVQVNHEIKEKVSTPQIVIYDNAGVAYSVDASELGLEYDYTNEVNVLWSRERRKPWFERLSWNSHYTVSAQVQYDALRLEQWIDTLPFIQDELADPEKRVYIERTPDGYQLIDETKQIPDIAKIRAAIADSLRNHVFEIFLSEQDCYYDAAYTEEMLRTITLFEQVQDFQNFGLTLGFGNETEQINAGVVSQWIQVDADGTFLLDENGRLQLDPAQVAQYVDQLADQYDTYEKPHEFLTTAGEWKTIESKDYGNQLDREAQTEFLIQTFYDYVYNGYTMNADLSAVYEPIYSEKALFQGLDDIGPNYIEIDMTNQMLYLYLERELMLETEVVTGNLRWKLGTPEMICAVYGKYRNRVLRGPGYESPVSYWVPIYKNIGIHDASWRRNFGGEIYKTNGSHGCINIPKEIMPDIYSQIELGTPVILYY